MREVVLKLTSQKDLIKHQSDAVTFGQLKNEMKQVKWDGMRVVERSTKSTLQLDDAILPQGDFILFLVPEKVKSGMTKKEGGLKKLKNIEKASYNELRSHMSWLNRNKNAELDVSGGTEDLRKILLKYREKAPVKEKVSTEDKVPVQTKVPIKGKEKYQSISENSVGIIEGCREVINRTLDNIVECTINGTIDKIIDGTIGQPTTLQYNIEGLEEEIKKIRNALKGGGYRKVD